MNAEVQGTFNEIGQPDYNLPLTAGESSTTISAPVVSTIIPLAVGI